MRKYGTIALVSLVMIMALLAITNPSRKNSYMFDYEAGRLDHDYGIFSIYKKNNYTVSADGKHKIYKRYLGIASSFYELKPEELPLVDSL